MSLDPPPWNSNLCTATERLEALRSAMLGPKSMATEQPPVLEFPAMLHGSAAAIERQVRAEGHWWAREYLETGAFAPPRQLRPVAPGEVLVMHSGTDVDSTRPRWRIHMFLGVFKGLDEGVQEGEQPRTEAAFESFCLGTPWGALYYTVAPPPPRSAERMASRLASLLRFWDVLEVPRYVYRLPDTKHTLEGLMESIYRSTLEAWCPGGPASLREHMALAVERMARATRADCEEAVLRVIPGLLEAKTNLRHRDVLNDSGFLRERLRALAPKKFEALSSAYPYTVTMQLAAWDRELERH